MCPACAVASLRAMAQAPEPEPARLDPTERVELLLGDLHGTPAGLSSREAARRLGARRAQRAGPPRRAALAARAGAPVRASAGAAPVGRRCPGLGRGHRAGGDRGRAGDLPQRGLRLRPGDAGRARGRGARPLPAAARHGPARRPRGGHRRRRARPRRRHGDRGGRPDMRRRPPADGRRSRSTSPPSPASRCPSSAPPGRPGARHVARSRRPTSSSPAPPAPRATRTRWCSRRA